MTGPLYSGGTRGEKPTFVGLQPWPPTHPALNVRSVTSINDHLVVGADGRPTVRCPVYSAILRRAAQLVSSEWLEMRRLHAGRTGCAQA